MSVEEVPVVDESDGRRRRAPASTQMLAWVRIWVGSQLLQPLESFPRSHTCSPTARICDGSAMSVWQTDRAFSSRHLCLTGSRRAVKPRCRLSSPRSYPSLRVCRCKGSRWWIRIDVELFRGRSRADGGVKKKAEEEEGDVHWRQSWDDSRGRGAWICRFSPPPRCPLGVRIASTGTSSSKPGAVFLPA